MPNVLSILNELASTRKASHLTQAELAQRSGVNRMTVGRIESGLDPRLSTVQELARAMGMDIMLVPKGLRPEIEGFVRSGGKLVSQPPGVGAPKSVVDLIEIGEPSRQEKPRGR
jgi:transcriptional regulator with XRE-family HTH domain